MLHLHDAQVAIASFSYCIYFDTALQQKYPKYMNL